MDANFTMKNIEFINGWCVGHEAIKNKIRVTAFHVDLNNPTIEIENETVDFSCDTVNYTYETKRTGTLKFNINPMNIISLEFDNYEQFKGFKTALEIM